MDFISEKHLSNYSDRWFLVSARVPVRQCIWLCFGYVIESLILIQEMTSSNSDFGHPSVSFWLLSDQCSSRGDCSYLLCGLFHYLEPRRQVQMATRA